MPSAHVTPSADLVRYLSETAAELAQNADSMPVSKGRPKLDEAIELVALGARLMARANSVAASGPKVRRAA